MKKLLLVLLTGFLVACSSAPPKAPTPFTTGAQVDAPIGCVELRKQHSNADC